MLPEIDKEYHDFCHSWSPTQPIEGRRPGRRSKTLSPEEKSHSLPTKLSPHLPLRRCININLEWTAIRLLKPLEFFSLLNLLYYFWRIYFHPRPASHYDIIPLRFETDTWIIGSSPEHELLKSCDTGWYHPTTLWNGHMDYRVITRTWTPKIMWHWLISSHYALKWTHGL